jgi:hypothetical protein
LLRLGGQHHAGCSHQKPRHTSLLQQPTHTQRSTKIMKYKDTTIHTHTE